MLKTLTAVYRQALKAKGESLREPTNEFYGDRSAGIEDEWGNQWWIATHQEDVSDEELERRKEEFYSAQNNPGHNTMFATFVLTEDRAPGRGNSLSLS
jgi:hypothetical protein